MNKIVVGISGRASTRRIYEAMANPNVELWQRCIGDTNEPYWRVYKNGDINKSTIVTKPNFENDTIIRWGCRMDLRSSNCTYYNKAKFIKLASVKSVARTLFTENGISVPPAVTVRNYKKAKYPVIARPFEHQGGADIIVLKTPAAFIKHFNENTGWYYSEFIPKDRELRIHVAFGKILAVMEKTPPENKKDICWNHGDDSWTILKWSDYPYDACLEALKAVKVLGLDTGGVDVMLKGEKAFVLEVNTAPTLSPYTAQRYAEFFNWLFNGEKKEHWDFTKFKKSDSFAWKHSQLAIKKSSPALI